MSATVINTAEAIIEPFWDPNLCELSEWTIEPGDEHGLEVSQGWCFVTFEWSRRPAAGPALSMERSLNVDCSGYDGLVLSVMAPPESVARLVADTDLGERVLITPPAGAAKREHVLALEGATAIRRVRIEIDSHGSGIESGWFNWLGLRHKAHLDRLLTVKSNHDPRWPKHLKGEEFVPEFKPTYGLMLTQDEIAALRERHDELLARDGVSPFLKAADAARAFEPEELIHRYVNFWGDSRYNRERDHGKHILTHGLNAAIAGHLTRDASLLRLAARYAMSIAMCEKWDDGFICFFPGSDWEHRCFVQSLCAFDVAAILDLAGEYFTEVGRDFLLRRLAEEAIGSINYITWKHEYIYHCNQLAWFTAGRMLALGVLEKHYPRVRDHIDIAYRDLCESLDYSILSDGGYVEGPSYFGCVGRDGGLGLYFYSRVTGASIDSVIPPAMMRCGDFGELVSSTDAEQDVIPICDASSGHDFISQAIMASVIPGSSWGRMLAKRMDINGGWPEYPGKEPSAVHVPRLSHSAIAWNLSASAVESPDDPSPVLVLPEMGPAMSLRFLNGSAVKLFIQGNQAGAGHTHEDKGSFVLECAGETLAMDPGTCDYSNPLAGLLKNCERHNMLVPTGVQKRPHPESPLPADVKPIVSGDAVSFHAEIDVSPGWEHHFSRWNRTWNSPSPHHISITDEYELVRGDGVEFLWQTRLGVTVDGPIAVISGSNVRAVLEAPDGTEWRLDELPLVEGTQHRLALPYSGTTGKFTVEVKLEVIATGERSA